MVAEGPLTATQIYEQITKGEGTGSLSDAQRAAHELTRRHHERAQRLAALTQKTLAGWQGGASMAAVDATMPVVEAAADDVAHLTRAQTAIGSQMDAFGTAKNSVKPVPPEQPAPTADDVKAVMSGSLIGYWSRVQGYQADSQHNIDTFASYHSASTANGDELPAQYAQLTDPGGSVTLDEGGAGKPTVKGFGDGSDGREHGTGEPYRGPSGPSGPHGPSTPSGPSGPHTPAPDSGPQPGQSPQPGQYPGPHQPGAQQPDDGTRANSYTPPQTTPVVPPAANLDFGPTGKPSPTYNTPGAFPPGYGPGTSGPGLYGPGGRPPGVTGGPGVTGRPGGTGQQPGMGGRSGAGMHGEGMAGRGTTGAAGAAGRGGANGMPMGAGAGRGGKGEEDKEKKAPAYLQNPDPDETFGGYIEKPTPPVIGEKKK
ncbi:PPE domain-containing protein [Amycolatopsis japonica]|uniref:PPE domain-containing protein n=1 Tax=Amycolatopsis japonica TaxID=208439 RepID=UPI003317F3B2